MRTAAALLAAAVIAGCGGSPSAEEQVRDTARKGVQALTSDHPERACQYMVDRDACVGAAVLTRGMDVAALTGIPEDWEEMLERATVVVKGDTATITGFDVNGDGKPGRYVRKDGRWLADNS